MHPRLAIAIGALAGCHPERPPDRPRLATAPAAAAVAPLSPIADRERAALVTDGGTPSVRASLAPTDRGIALGESGITPADGGVALLDSRIAPADSRIAPADSRIAPADSRIAPADSRIAPADGHIAPADGRIAPADSRSAPADSRIAPADGRIAPATAGPARAGSGPSVARATAVPPTAGAPPAADAGVRPRPPDCIFAGTREITRNATIECASATFERDAVLRVRHGIMLRLFAERLVVDGSARIDGTGDAGGEGGIGSPHTGANRDGAWVAMTEDGFVEMRRSCTTEPNHIFRGGKGQLGQRGGSGARIYLSQYPSGGVLSILIRGGPGGPGGPGGLGRMIRADKDAHCPECVAYCMSGPKGDVGPEGPAGYYKILPADQLPPLPP